ncbi:helix-turn-helix domain-containing protein [Reyranella soli]|jgi:transcriptional regulator with XRE-family HTH domain|uniref:XRE family transcriptional regulator n=1 Tax=Reyranella soli TaxID=1230389 RepID=A0A512NCA2_9HYPH|nr:XRE family transcriptional regulator [Reyranella soli]GEP56578.1 XRE family transcriptional regulator [Reyranella soli]
MAGTRKSQRAAAIEPRPDPASSFGEIVRRLRLTGGLKLQDLAARCGVASSTISKIENGLMSPTYDTILRLADGLKVDTADLFRDRPEVSANGRRSITRRDQGLRRSTGQYDYELLCADVANKPFTPLLTTLRAHALSEFPALVTHEGVEFFYVLSGKVTLHTEHYEPALLSTGDSCYFDSTMGHACLSAGSEDAQILWIATRLTPALAEDRQLAGSRRSLIKRRS